MAYGDLCEVASLARTCAQLLQRQVEQQEPHRSGPVRGVAACTVSTSLYSGWVPLLVVLCLSTVLPL